MQIDITGRFNSNWRQITKSYKIQTPDNTITHFVFITSDMFFN